MPDTLLADANHGAHEGIIDADQRGVELLVAVPERSKRPGRQSNDHPAVEAWRQRMASDDAKRTYRARAGLCELTNAHARQAGMQQLLVRGTKKVTCVALLTAISYNILQHASTLMG